MVSCEDEKWMRRALSLAAKGRYTTRPNPAVGCVIMKAGQIMGEGFHQKAGGPHAEVHALHQAGENARGADVYVTLEPCAHQGRTGPCVQALIQAGVKRVFIASRDPHPKAQGGLEILRQAGIEVFLGLCEADAQELNIGFFHAIEHSRPFVRCKLAMSVDGHTALKNGESFWITGAQARASVQELRAQSGALITGIGTVLQDDPKLTIRAYDAAPSIRVVMDREFRLPHTAKILQEPGEIWWVGFEGLDPDKRVVERCQKILKFPKVTDRALDFSSMGVLSALYQAQVWDVLIEAGPELSGKFFEAGLIDELWVYGAPCFMGVNARPLLNIESPSSMEKMARWKTQAVNQVGEDVCWVMRPSHAPKI